MKQRIVQRVITMLHFYNLNIFCTSTPLSRTKINK